MNIDDNFKQDIYTKLDTYYSILLIIIICLLCIMIYCSTHSIYMVHKILLNDYLDSINELQYETFMV